MTGRDFRIGASAIVTAFALTALLPSAAQAQRDFSKVEITTISLGDGIFMLQGAGGNIGLSVGEDGPFVIDDQFAPLSDKIMAAIKVQSDQPVAFVLNTHYHGDHTGGNEAFGKAGAHIVAHDNVRQRLLERDKEADAVSPDALPVITFSDSLTFHWNEQEIYVWHPNPAHTDGDAIIFMNDTNVVHMGDVFFNGGYPYIDVGAGGSLNGYIETHEKVLGMINSDTMIIPGHGPLAKKADLERTVSMLKDVRQRIQSLIDAGLEEDAIVADDPLSDLNGEWGGGFINGERMVRTVYRSLSSD